MKRLTLRVAIALLTFLVGIGTSAAWVVRSKPAPPQPTNPAQLNNPPIGNAPMLEMVFVLDTTGSMSGLLEGAKQRIWGLVNEVMQAPSRPSVRIGLVAYRDRGDDYVTEVLPLTSDLDKVYATLMNYRAAGGGDGPENVRRALADGVNRAAWSPANSSQVAQILFLVGDAPPHDDYQDEPDTLVTTAEAVRRGMIINTIQCGNQTDTTTVWQQIARRGEGRYFAIAQDGGVETVATPYDTRLSEIGTKLGGTYMAYGGGAGPEGEKFRTGARARQQVLEMSVATSAAPMAAADRAVNKALNRQAYVGDLLQSIENGSVKLADVKTEDLPDELQKLSPEARQREVNKRLDERRKMREEIVSLSNQRDEFIAVERKKNAAAGKLSGFDAAVASALKEQLARKGIK